MGEVSRAWDEGLQRYVALKVLRRDDPELVERLLREARAQARLDHPNICKVFQVEDVGGRPTIVMQFIDGRRLDEAAVEMTLEDKVRVIRDAAEAVHHAHTAGIIHRDLKPGNIMVARRDDGTWHPWLVDFGIAHEVAAPGLTRTGQVMGTPSYMAPEQISGDPGAIDRRTDVYALGAVLYELLTGTPPFRKDSDIATMISALSEDPPQPRAMAPSIPRDLETVVLRCLDKEPHGRYPTAAGLADDLDRWMRGEPVEARRVSPGRKLLYRARRHPAQATLVVALIAALLVAAGIWTRGRQVAAETARAAQRFGRNVERIEARMRQAHLLPVHDIRGEREAVLRIVDEIEEELGRLGRPAEGPGQYALGRAHLVLGELADARDHLQRAADAGESSPAHAHATGLTLAGLYRKRLEVAARIPDSELREAAIDAARRELLEPALSHLRRADVRETGEALFVSALIARLEKRYDDAVAQARRASAEQPWLYEAVHLEGDVALARELAAYESGDYETAREQLELAGDSYRRATEIGRSDPALYEAECERARRLVDLEVVTGGPIEDAARAAELSCSTALAIDSERASAHRLLSMIHGRLATELWWNRGRDPNRHFEAATEHGSRAVELDADDPLNHVAVGRAHGSRSQWLIDRGEDAAPTLERAIASFERAVELEPDLVDSRLALGRAHLQLGRHVAARGGDPRERYELAVTEVRHALELDPDLVGALSLLGGVHMMRGDWETTHGVDPRASLTASLDAFSRATEVNPSSPRILNNIGLTAWILGDLERMLGDDPGPSLDRAEASLRTSLNVNPELVSARINLAGVHHTRALHDLATGGDALPHVEATLTELGRLREIYPDDFHVDWTDALIVRAKILMGEGRSPEEPLARAITEARTGIDLYPDRAPQLRALAEAHLVRARWRHAHGLPPSADLRAGLAAADRALRIDPELAKAHIVLGELQLVAAETDRSRSAALADAAGESLQRALEINPFLENEVGPVLERTRELAGDERL